MALIAGTSVFGLQRLGAFDTLTIAQYQIVLPEFPAANPQRVGYYFMQLRKGTAPNQQLILARGGVYRPGIFFYVP